MSARVVRPGAVLAVLSGALALISLDNTILNVALPSLQEDLGASTSQLQWVVDAYSVVFAGALLLAGVLGDRFGRRRVLLIGLVIFGVGSLAAGLSWDVQVLTACRAFMGIGAACIMPSTLSILTQVFTDPRQRVRAIGTWAAVSGAAIAVGPILGGVLLEVSTWHAVFLINPPLALIVGLLTLRLIPESADPARPRVDVLGAALSTAGVIAFIVTVIELPEAGIDPVTVTSSIASVVLLVGFVLWERRAPNPLLPMSLFRNRVFTVSAICVGLVYFALMGMMFFLPQFLQLVQDLSPLEAGLATMPGALALLVGSLISPRLSDRWGSRRVLVLGLTVVALGLLALGMVTRSAPYILVGVPFTLIGLGLGFALPQATNGILASVPRERSGLGSAINDGFAELGGSIGVALLGAILSAGYRGAIEQAIAAAGSAIDTIPASVVEACRESLAAAVIAISQLPAALSRPIEVVAGNAFVAGMGTALWVGAALVIVGVVLARTLLPRTMERASE